MAVFSNAQDSIVVIKDAQILNSIGNSIWTYVDTTSKMNTYEVLKQDNFVKSTAEVPNLMATENPTWVKFCVVNKSNSESLVLEIPYPTIDHISFYEIRENGIRLLSEMGEIFPYSSRKYDHQHYLFDLNSSPNDTTWYLIRIKSTDQVLLPLNVADRETTTKGQQEKDFGFGIYAGIILVMFFYNLFIYFTTKDASYLFYCFYIVFVGLTQATVSGYSFRYLWPNNTWLTLNSIIIIPSFTAFTSIAFFRTFVRIERYNAYFDRGLWFFGVLYLGVFITGVSGNITIAYNIMNACALGLAIYLLVSAILLTKKGNRQALFFLLAWSVFLVGIIIFVAKDIGVLPYNSFTINVLQYGSAIEVVLLSFGLADRINTLKKEKVESQQKVVSTLRENRRIITQQNEILEKKVKERTLELEASNRELEITLNELKEAQAQLVEAEKMASLGQLTAGIAHEINNPINFVTSNVNPLKRDIGDLLDIIGKYRGLTPETDLTPFIKEMDEIHEEVETDYIIEEINQLINGISEGANRTAEIIRGLRNFSRLDESDLKKADINEGLSSTLLLLKSSTTGNVKIEKNFSSLPQIECFPGKLNQVFMNIINNGLQAVMKNAADNPGVVSVTTEDLGPDIRVTIGDNGVGMDEKTRQRIFEPFFTTKDVGEGTGLGLSIVFSIIENHNGNIKVESEVGKGTKFIITLPKIHE